MGKTCDEGQQLLRDTEFVSSIVLCLGKEREEGNDLLA
jgi:hypothetical protein